MIKNIYLIFHDSRVAPSSGGHILLSSQLTTHRTPKSFKIIIKSLHINYVPRLEKCARLSNYLTNFVIHLYSLVQTHLFIQLYYRIVKFVFIKKRLHPLTGWVYLRTYT